MSRFIVALTTPLLLFWCSMATSARPDGAPLQFGTCKPIGERTQEVGCWILLDHSLGSIDQAHVFWHLDVYPTRSAAEKAQGPRGTVVESFGKVWLLSIEEAGWRPRISGERIAEIGPLVVSAGETCLETPAGKMVGRAGGDPRLGTEGFVHSMR